VVVTRSAARYRVTDEVASTVLTPARGRRLAVAVDGRDGAGKSVFGDELAAVLARHGRPVVRASIDGFHNPRAVRYRRGRRSPEGFFLDSFDLDAFTGSLLDAFAPGGDGRFRRAIFDHTRDEPDCHLLGIDRVLVSLDAFAELLHQGHP
jgi:uridine kinase